MITTKEKIVDRLKRHRQELIDEHHLELGRLDASIADFEDGKFDASIEFAKHLTNKEG